MEQQHNLQGLEQGWHTQLPQPPELQYREVILRFERALVGQSQLVCSDVDSDTCCLFGVTKGRDKPEETLDASVPVGEGDPVYIIRRAPQLSVVKNVTQTK